MMWQSDNLVFWNVATSLLYLLPFYEAMNTGLHHHAVIYLLTAFSSIMYHLDESQEFWHGVDMVFATLTVLTNLCVSYTFHPNFTKCAMIAAPSFLVYFYTQGKLEDPDIHTQRKWHIVWHALSAIGTYFVLYEADNIKKMSF